MDRDRWARLCERIGCDSVGAFFDRLQESYSERHRHYHTGRHIDECLTLFDELRGLCRFPDEVELAIWLHDAVYRPRRSDNEERSARLAADWLTAEGVESDVVERVRSLILVTRHTGRPASRDEQVLVDIDLHILGAPADRFDEYEAQVRREYSWVPSTVFRRRRAEILGDFQARDPLYHTEECRTRFEAAAKRNLARSIERLTR